MQKKFFIIKVSIAVTRTATGGILYLGFRNLLKEPLSWLIFHNAVTKMLLILMASIAQQVLDWYYIAYDLVMHWWECNMKNVLTYVFIVIFYSVFNSNQRKRLSSFIKRFVNCRTVFLVLCICNSGIQWSKRQSWWIENVLLFRMMFLSCPYYDCFKTLFPHLSSPFLWVLGQFRGWVKEQRQPRLLSFPTPVLCHFILPAMWSTCTEKVHLEFLGHCLNYRGAADWYLLSLIIFDTRSLWAKCWS